MSLENPVKILEQYKDTFHRPARLELIPTIEDIDETKFESLDKLFGQMHKFQKEMSSAGIGLFKRHETDHSATGYLLTDSAYQKPCPISIQFFTPMLDPNYRQSFWPGHDIFFRVRHDLEYRGEFRDVAEIFFRFTSEEPFHWASAWYYDLWSGEYFRGIDYTPGSSPGYAWNDIANPPVNFKTKHFIEAVDLLCAVTNRIIERKEFLQETAPENNRVKPRTISARI